MLRIQIYYDLLQKNNTALITAQYERSLLEKRECTGIKTSMANLWLILFVLNLKEDSF